MKERTARTVPRLEVIAAAPPPYRSICAAMGYEAPPKAYMTYAGRIWNPNGLPDPPQEIVAHEAVHVRQQAALAALAPDGTVSRGGSDAWWGRWLRDPEFRAEQEAEGYAAQLDALGIRDRNLRCRALNALAASLSSPLYGSCVTHGRAKAMIEARSAGRPYG